MRGGILPIGRNLDGSEPGGYHKGKMEGWGMIRQRMEKYLEKQYFCSAAELNGAKTYYTVHTKAERPYLKIMAYRNCVIVCTSAELRDKMQKFLRGKNRDEIFEMPFAYGQTIHFVPNAACASTWQRDIRGCEVIFLSGEEVLRLDGLTGFENAVASTGDTPPTEALCIAVRNGKIVGAAGAAKTELEDIWEIGVDVTERYRNAGVATALVARLTGELLARDIVPFYSASVTNIGSQMVASRCGYIPLWVDTFGTTLDGSSVYHDSIGRIKL